jgi:hypothetical protein
MHELTSPCVTDNPQEPRRRWENEGGALGPEPKQTTTKRLEIPVPKRRHVIDALRKLVQPAKNR